MVKMDNILACVELVLVPSRNQKHPGVFSGGFRFPYRIYYTFSSFNTTYNDGQIFETKRRMYVGINIHV